MPRRKRGKPVNGWLVLDKPYDMTSTQAVGACRRLFDAQKAGHAGTLDPLATGILAVAFGEATKTVPFVMDGRKSYRFTARWGVATTTDDAEGEAIATSDVRPSSEDIQAILNRFVGEIEQLPPKFSAIKVNGERAYDLARDGEEVELKSRRVDIYDLRLVDTPDADHGVFEAETGKGAYIRSLVRDMGQALGTCGHVSQLRRTAVGPFDESQAKKLDLLEQMRDNPALMGELSPVSTALDDIPACAVSGGDALKLQRGQAVVLTPAQAKTVRGEEKGFIPAVLAETRDGPQAICALDGLKLKPTRVFNL
ncbi:MAG: tRNA pseudouridine(55) synthase TruB [Pseudomonadota bacterium]